MERLRKAAEMIDQKYQNDVRHLWQVWGYPSVIGNHCKPIFMSISHYTTLPQTLPLLCIYIYYIALYLRWHDDISRNAAPSVPTNPFTIRAKSLTKCNRRINRTKRIKPTSRKAGLSPLPKKRNRKLSTPRTVDTWWEKLETAEKPKINAIEWDQEPGKRTWESQWKVVIWKAIVIIEMRSSCSTKTNRRKWMGKSWCHGRRQLTKLDSFAHLSLLELVCPQATSDSKTPNQTSTNFDTTLIQDTRLYSTEETWRKPHCENILIQ